MCYVTPQYVQWAILTYELYVALLQSALVGKGLTFYMQNIS